MVGYYDYALDGMLQFFATEDSPERLGEVVATDLPYAQEVIVDSPIP